MSHAPIAYVPSVAFANTFRDFVRTMGWVPAPGLSAVWSWAFQWFRAHDLDSQRHCYHPSAEPCNAGCIDFGNLSGDDLLSLGFLDAFSGLPREEIHHRIRAFWLQYFVGSYV